MNLKPFVIIGAGIAGLSCARALTRRGHSVVLYDKGRSVGGRCSTWRATESDLFDYGVAYLHGKETNFTDLFRQVPATFLEGWPNKIEGTGHPCNRNGFSKHAVRGAFVEGVSALPKFLSQGLTIHQQMKAIALEGTMDGIRITFDDKSYVFAEKLILAMPNEQTTALLNTFPVKNDAIQTMHHLIEQLVTVPCLTLMATYPKNIAKIEWDLMLPSNQKTFQLISNESSKRPNSEHLSLMFQARPNWSAKLLESPPEQWSTQMLEDASNLLGAWVKSPRWSKTHRWRYARIDSENELGSTLMFSVGSSKVGIIGESYAFGIGVEGAYLSGESIATFLGS